MCVSIQKTIIETSQVDGYLLAAHNSILALDSGNCGDADAVPADWSGLDVAPQQAVVEGGGGAFEYRQVLAPAILRPPVDADLPLSSLLWCVQNGVSPDDFWGGLG